MFFSKKVEKCDFQLDIYDVSRNNDENYDFGHIQKRHRRTRVKKSTAKFVKGAVPPISAWEMEIMQILWKSDGLTILQARQAFDRDIGYTTVQTRLNRLVDKGLVRKAPERPALYRAAVGPEAVSAGHLDLLLEKVAEGSVVPLIAQLMKGRRFTSEEIESLQKLLDEQERRTP